MYCWGSTVYGELGLGGIEDEQILGPVPSPWSYASHVTSLACGDNHTLFLCNDGKVFSCGNNDFGQLGHNHPTKRPHPVSALDAYRMKQISCGAAHSLAINEWGQTFVWGSNSLGQLGMNGDGITAPRILRSLATHHVVQIASGLYHSVALMNNGDIYAWGANSYGQLGLGIFTEKEENPQLVKSLLGVPFSFIACGGHHTFALTKSGAVYAWGKNTCGQLGLNDIDNHCYPTHLKSLRSIKVIHISCGEEFSLFLTLDGGVFTCGSGNYGQLGHGEPKDEIVPRKVMELMGTVIVQAECGRRHTMVVTENSRIQGCGLGTSGQLGCGSTIISPLPRALRPPWQSAVNGSPLDDISVKRIFVGGDRCFVLMQPFVGSPTDCRQHDSATQILTIESSLLAPCLDLPEGDHVDQDLLCYIETVFKSLACINGSFLVQGYNHYCCNGKNSGIDYNKVSEVFGIISHIENISIREVILQSVTSVVETLSSNPPDAEALRCYLTIPLYHEFLNPKRWKTLHTPLARMLSTMKTIPQKLITSWCHSLHREHFERIVDVLKNVIYFYLKDGKVKETKFLEYDIRIVHILNALECLNKINVSNPTQNKVPSEAFYLHDLLELYDVRQDYVNWLRDAKSNNFYLCNYPFLFDVLCKTSILEIDQALQMHAAMNDAATQAITDIIFHGRTTTQQFITLVVSRETIVMDALRELHQYETSELKKPLKVKFYGEEAEDAGGVRKEFFMLLLREIFDPKYGMFKYFSETRTVWFSEQSFEDEDMYMLIGQICGLAIYNFTIINVGFPLVMYKKLLKVPITLEDLAGLSPVMANSLKSLLSYEGNDVEDVFCLTFEITRDVFGEMQSVELKEGGSNIPVTKDNKQEYVDLYVDFIFNKSIASKFEAFYNGFYRVCGGRVLKLFEPHELMAVVVGNEDYDWVTFETVTQYKGGYTSSDSNIRFFWEIFHSLSERDKRNFLLFLTGSDRIPIQGMRAITMTIQPTSDDKYLPVAHTCFNLLDLPRYSTKEKMRYKLLQAIQQTEGFSLV